MFSDIHIQIKSAEGRSIRPRLQEAITHQASHDAFRVTVYQDTRGEVLFEESQNSRWTTYFLGEIFRYRGIRETLKSVKEKIVDELSSDSFSPEALNGRFLVFAYDKQSKKWHVWTDRYGTMHAYYLNQGKYGSFGTIYENLVRYSSKRHDWDALQAYLRVGFFPKDQTYFKDISIMETRSHYVFDEQGLMQHHQRYIDWKYEPNEKRSYEATLEEFHCLLLSVMEDMTASGDLILPLSGGLDSRTLVANVSLLSDSDDVKSRLESYSYGYSVDSPEIKAASAVAKVCNLDFKAFTIKPYLLDSLNVVLAATEGFQDITQCRQAFLRDQLQHMGQYLLAGHWGDVWFSDMPEFSDLQGECSHETLALEMVKKFRKHGSEWFNENIDHSLKSSDTLDQELARLISVDFDSQQEITSNLFKAKYIKTEWWSFRWTLASLRMFQTDAFPRLPFYDHRIGDFFSTVPTKYLHQRQLQIDYIKKYYPDLGRVIWDSCNEDLYHYQYANNLSVPKRGFNKLKRILTNKKVYQRNWEVQFEREFDKGMIENYLLEESDPMHSLFSKAALEKLIKGFREKPTRENGYVLSMLMTVGQQLKRMHAL